MKILSLIATLGFAITVAAESPKTVKVGEFTAFHSGREISKANKVIIYLHGYGDDGTNSMLLAPYLADLKSDAFLAVQAPHLLDEGGYTWVSSGEGVERLGEISESVGAFMKQLKETNPDTKIYAGGFSQGASVVNHMIGITSVDGLFSWSGGFPPKKVKSVSTIDFILFCHGTNDEIMPIDVTIKFNADLKKQGAKTKLIEFEGAHTVTQEVLRATKSAIYGD